MAEHDSSILHSNETDLIFNGVRWSFPPSQIDPFKATCSNLTKKNRQHVPLRDFLNQQLPIHTDLDFLQGGVLSAAVLHEMLMQKTPRLEFQKYCETAARLVQPLTLHPALLHNVPVAMAGQVNANMQITKLKGQVYSRSVLDLEFVPPHDEEEYKHD